MQASTFAIPARAGRTGLAGVALVLLLGSCGAGPSGQGGFQKQYGVARNALEGGDYAQAKRAYLKLIGQAGPLAPRMQLEYAHAELRSGDFAAAAKTAGTLAQGQSGEARAAALAVQGTAQHELGLSLLAGGQAEAGKQQLQAAQTALDEVLKSHAGMDPLGSLAGRQASIRVRLGKL
ncbi:hypothetical protein K3555_21185 (plasmid) [Leisingera sp. M527]|uniref:hypothetical protein n=1 Tax=Leisingera sp. M527 TaxID=2867014 RepID=UPI0021A45475|nr:hypothetical protein [Leisingera sp. M527]UWQ35176.1 hypothetical protein K3555_21185 [Leisingera sp. M527]